MWAPRKTPFFKRLIIAAWHTASIDMCPSPGAYGIGHVILDDMVSVFQRASTAMQRAVLAFCACFSQEAQGTRIS